MLVSRGMSRLVESSATRASSVLPPPLVRRMKGMLLLWRWESALCALGSGSEERTRTPSILWCMSKGCSGWYRVAYSNANAKSGVSRDDVIRVLV